MKQLVRIVGICIASAVLLLAVSGFSPGQAHADAVLVQSSIEATHNGGSSVSVSLSSEPTAGNMLIAICGARDNITITGPSGFTVAIRENGTPSQAIFYKVVTGTEGTSFQCSGGGNNTRQGIHIYEFSGLEDAESLDATGSAASSGSAPSSGSVTTTAAETLLIAGVTINSGNAELSGLWSNSFTHHETTDDGGSAGSRSSYAGASRAVSSTGTYSTATSSSGSGAWRGQIAAFKVFVPVLAADIVDGAGDPVSNPSASFAPVNTSFACQMAAATLGTASQRVRVTNTTGNGDWTLTLEPTDGTSAEWSNGTDNYAFNDPSGAPPGCENGQLSVNPSAGSVTPQGSCGTAGLSLGSGFAFSASEQVMTLLTASGSQTGCEFDITGIELIQQIPAEVPASQSPYSIDMTLTITAN